MTAPAVLGAAETSLALAVLAQAGLTFLLFLAMELTRSLAMIRGRLALQTFARGQWLAELLPPYAVRVGDNYNHLFEAPTVFYALALLAIALRLYDPALAWLGWAFVGLRVAHSLVQTTVNRVALRFPLFALSWLAMAAMIARIAQSLLA